jgi:hypothetical protein
VTGRGLRGRQRARGLLLTAVAIDVLGGFLFVALVVDPPNTMGGSMRFDPPSLVGWLIPAIGIALNLLGLGLMIRIYRADPEAHPSSFRATRH